MKESKRLALDILHIYAGTRGSMGLYLHEIYSAVHPVLSQDCVTSWDFPFDYGKKWFYRYSDISKSIYLNRFKVLRRAIRAVELFLTLFLTLVLIFRRKPNSINYGLTSDTYIELLFLWLVNGLTNTTVIITAHDVLPFGAKNADHLKRKTAKKKLFFDLADYLIVHNSSSLSDLKRYFKQEYKTIYIPFPIMDLNQLNYQEITTEFVFKTRDIFTVSMVGNFRKEKGLEVLIKAWEIFSKKFAHVKLVVAGYVHDNEIRQVLHNKENLEFCDRFLTDDEYRSLICDSDLVVLPYRRGTNSGIPSSVLTQNTLLLTSDISAFRTNGLVNKDFMFKEGNHEDLARKLEWIYKMTNTERAHYLAENKKVLDIYRSDFRVIVKENILKMHKQIDV